MLGATGAPTGYVDGMCVGRCLMPAGWNSTTLFSGDVLPGGRWRRSLAIEPMTCPPNAFADGVDLVVLEPGETWAGSWTLSWTPGG